MTRSAALLFIFVIAFCLISCTKDKPVVDIIVTNKSNAFENNAASIFKDYLTRLYPKIVFNLTEKSTGIGPTVLIGTVEDLKRIDRIPVDSLPLSEESYSVFKTILNGKETGVICGFDQRGLLYGIYDLLEKSGCGFYLSEEVIPSISKFSLEKWSLKSEPLVKERIVFNWHNFISGCTGWDYKEWCSWIDQSAKMKYNTIMVHAYGNNPMFSFEYNGLKKKVGYLTTSVSGRDWGAQHVNDVRRLKGGEIFNDAVFGSEAAKVPDDQRSESAVNLMSKVFQHAKEMNMNINFAMDVDTWSANPQNIISSLPEECLIRFEEYRIVNPDTPEGYKYYKSQISGLIKMYPQITTISVWVRSIAVNWPGYTIWRELKPNQFPQSWLKEYNMLLAANPDLIKDKYSASNFAISKIIIAYQKALKEIGKPEINILLGSWNWNYLPSANVILPEDVGLIPLDAEFKITDEEIKILASEIGTERKLIPVVWAHHDDHRYIGKPFTPYSDFTDLLKERNVSGFGIIHWTTRPLDLFFTSLGNQVWASSKNENLSKTVSDYVYKVFGSNQDKLNEYMLEWITNGPMFARETADHFMDVGRQLSGEKIAPSSSIISAAENRIRILDDVKVKKLSYQARKHYYYYRQSEEFYISFFENWQKFNDSYDMLNRGSIDSAKIILTNVNPEETIRCYVKAASNLEMTKGEKAIVISMNTRWLPDFLDLKQQSKMLSVLKKFGPTQHDSLAQGAGHNTYHFDNKNNLWKVSGEKESGTGSAGRFSGEIESELPDASDTFLEIKDSIMIPLTTFSNSLLTEGNYNLELQYIDNNKNLRLILVTGKDQIKSEQVGSKVEGKLKNIVVRIDIDSRKKSFLKVIAGDEKVRLTNLVIKPLLENYH